MRHTIRLFKRTIHNLPVLLKNDTLDDDLPVVVLGHRATMHPELYSQKERTIYEGEILNSSYDGLCFQSERELKPGTKILLKKANFEPLSFGSKEFRECRAIVRWCTRIGTATPPCHHVGVQRLRSERLPMIDWKSPTFGRIKCF